MAEWVAQEAATRPMQTSVSQNPGATRDPDATWCVDVAARIGGGDKEAESQLIARMRPGLKMLLTARCSGDAEQAADLCQDTLVIVLQRLRSSTIEDPSRLCAFAAQTARQLEFDARRRTASHRTIVDSDAVDAAVPESPNESVVDDDLLVKLVRGVLSELGQDRDREILRRFYLQDEDKSDICRTLSVAPAAFDLLIFRARARVRSLLESRGLKARDLYCFVLPWRVRPWQS
jgi:RNA polymerase sigma-70 factor (ECF subfamily)